MPRLSLFVERIEPGFYVLCKHLGIYLRRLNVGMGEHLADNLDAKPCMQRLGGEGVPRHVRR